MDAELVKKMLIVQDIAMKDVYYLSLLEEYRMRDKQFLTTLKEMAPEHRDAIMDYLGAVHAIHERMVELALTLDEKC